MNSLNYSERDLQILKFIKKHSPCSDKKLYKKFERSALYSVKHLIDKQLISLREDHFVIHIAGMELLKDNELHTRSKAIGKVIATILNIVASLIGVVVGYYLGK